MLWMLHGAHHQRHHRVGRDAQREQRDEGRLRAGVVGGLRTRHALDGAAAEARGVLGELLLERVGGERPEHRAVARQQAQNRSEQRAARDRGSGLLEVLAARQQLADRPVHDVAGLRALQIAQDLREAEHAHGEDGDIEAVGDLGPAEGETLLAALEVGADGGEEDAHQDHGDRLRHRAARQHHGEHEAQHHEGEVVRRAEQQRPGRHRHGQRGDDEGGGAAGDERADGGDAEGHAGAPLLGHLVAVERGDHRRGLAGDVDQDGRRGAAVLGAVVDAGQHDQRADRVEPEGDRQEHGDGGDGTDARQHADERADQAAEKAKGQVSP